MNILIVEGIVAFIAIVLILIFFLRDDSHDDE